MSREECPTNSKQPTCQRPPNSGPSCASKAATATSFSAKRGGDSVLARVSGQTRSVRERLLSLPRRHWAGGWPSSPERPSELRVPRFPDAEQLRRLLRMVGGQVMRLAGISSQVVEPRRRNLYPRGDGRRAGLVKGVIVADQLPVALANRPLFTQPPVERVVRRRGGFSFQERKKIHAVEPPFRVDRYPRRGHAVGSTSSWITG